MAEQTTVWYIHGANSSSRSFAWIKEKLPPHEAIDVDYGNTTPLSDHLDRLKAAAERFDRPFSIVSHSIGGVMALGIANAVPDKINRIVTMATPFKGCRVATLLRWVAPCPLFDDIHPYSPFITEHRMMTPKVPMLSIVTTAGGTPIMSEPNDGVVSVASQKALRGPVYTELPVNHFEVLLAAESAALISSFIFGETRWES